MDISAASPRQLESAVRRAHGIIWAGGRRDPLGAFDEWAKLVFAKVYDERHTPNGAPRRFQVGAGETAVQVGSRIRDLFAEAAAIDPSVFSIIEIDLPDDKITEVVRTLEALSFTQTDLDSIGAAFEHFFSSVFRGELGQYFTRRELVRFICAGLELTERDRILDPAAGSGGFLLEAMMQVWHRIEEIYAGQPETDRRRFDFATSSLFAIEINQTLGHVCQANLLIHKDGHTNVEIDRSCLDLIFDHDQLNPARPWFTAIVGNPPFGDRIRRTDYADHLGAATPGDFELFTGGTIASEKLILERSVKGFLEAGGRLGMVVPDGLLNNPGELSHDPPLRRFLLRLGWPFAIVSLPDFAFRKAGAQNKTSILFYKKFTGQERARAEQHIRDWLRTNANNVDDIDELDPEEATEALASMHQEMGSRVFLAEAEAIGYSPTGQRITGNDLYQIEGDAGISRTARETILGCLAVFQNDPTQYAWTRKPPTVALAVSDMIRAHPSDRWDPKFHVFRGLDVADPPEGFVRLRLGDALVRREERITPLAEPDRLFVTITLGQDGQLRPREAGKGNNPPEWYGAYFGPGQWFQVRQGDVLLSRIDIWKGAVGIVPPELDGAIVTGEFPVYEVRHELLNSRFLALLLRSPYWRRAIRAITTGHSNRRRTHEGDLESLEVFIPVLAIQERVADLVGAQEERVREGAERLKAVQAAVGHLVLGEMRIDDLEEIMRLGGHHVLELAAEMDRVLEEDIVADSEDGNGGLAED